MEYILIIHLLADIRLKVSRLGEHWFPRGYYAYTGSALGLGTSSSLRKRVERHLQKEKHRFWHIDYLLAYKDAVIIAIIANETIKKMECAINRQLKNDITTRIPVMGFGASDCEEKCESHLLYLGEKNVKQKNVSLCNEKFGCKTVVVNY